MKNVYNCFRQMIQNYKWHKITNIFIWQMQMTQTGEWQMTQNHQWQNTQNDQWQITNGKRYKMDKKQMTQRDQWQRI